MSQHQLILTTDYEIFGNGCGDVSTCLIEPTRRMLEICDSFGARLCFFVDVCEIWSFETCADEDIRGNAEKIKGQLIEIVKSGHDIQLHLHPQWIDASYENGHWKLNYDLWRLPSVEPMDFGEYGKGVYGLLNKGKQWLEELIQPIDHQYACSAFRAGAWCIQPEEKVLNALKKLDFKYDTSAAPGMKFSGSLTQFDFTDLKKLHSSWGLGNYLGDTDVSSTLTEIPIASARSSFLNQIWFTWLKRSRKNRAYPENCHASGENTESSNIIEKFIRYILPGYRMLDFASGTSFEEMQFITTKFIQAKREQRAPIVAISHPKNFGTTSEFEKYMKWVQQHRSIRFESKSGPYFWR